MPIPFGEYIFQAMAYADDREAMARGWKEIVRCKDCAGYDPDDEDIREGRCYWWPEMPTVPAYGFCHQGEPKTAKER